MINIRRYRTLNLSPSALLLGTPIVSFFPFYLAVSLLKLKNRKMGTLVINVLLGNLGYTLDPTPPDYFLVCSYQYPKGSMKLYKVYTWQHTWAPK